MGQRFLEVRVRPARVAVIIDKGAREPDLRLAFEFLSKLWGGRYGQILAVDPHSADELTRFRLGESRPEYVYGIGLDDEHWRPAVVQACQPRGYGPLRLDFVRSIKQANREQHYLVDHALIHLFRYWDQSNRHKRSLRLVTPDTSSPMSPYCAATFGVHYQDLQEEFFDLETPFSGVTTADFLALATEFIAERNRSWLDVTGHKLVPYIVNWGLRPTIVLVRDLAPDLGLFWNLRSVSDCSWPAWIIPIPSQGACEQKVIEKVRDWLLSFLPIESHLAACYVTSQTVTAEECREFVAELQTALAGSPIDAVKYQPPGNRFPVVIPFEYSTVWPVEIKGSKLTILPPRPRSFEGIGPPPSWFVDLVKDLKTGRAIRELHLPQGTVAQELLNGPCPTGLLFTAIPMMGDGVDCVNLRCSSGEKVVNVQLPSGEEVLEETLREHGLEPIPDEKRSSYLPVIRRFGGLHLAANAFIGTSGLILKTLQEEPRRLREIKGTCKLGDGTIPREGYLESIDRLLQFTSERTRRIGRHRFVRHARNQSPEDQRLTSLLEFWADRSVLTREWKIGPCSRCNKVSFVPRLDIRRRVICPVCGNRVNLSESVPLGYSLDRPVRLALMEGIAPVVLTGRFLRRMSRRGFFWLPGVKYKIGDRTGDIDVLACCDGHLVFCECKQLEGTPPVARVWDDVVAQFLETVGIAKRCGASLAVLAAMVDHYPDHVRDDVAARIDGAVPHLLLTKQDLEAGHRKIMDRGHPRSVGLYDLVTVPFPEPS